MEGRNDSVVCLQVQALLIKECEPFYKREVDGLVRTRRVSSWLSPKARRYLVSLCMLCGCHGGVVVVAVVVSIWTVAVDV
jgi:hypothetical protein